MTINVTARYKVRCRCCADSDKLDETYDFYDQALEAAQSHLEWYFREFGIFQEVELTEVKLVEVVA